MVYLGLGDDAEYERYEPEYDDDHHEPERPVHHGRPAGASTSVATVGGGMGSGFGGGLAAEESGIGAVRPIGRSGDLRESAPVGPSSALGGTVRPRNQVVRPISVVANAKPDIVSPTSFNQAQEVADGFKGGRPVVMDLQRADRELSRRLIDFASGLCYGLGGKMERLTGQVYLLTPANVEVSADERRRLLELDLDD